MPYMDKWWVPGLQIGYEHTFTNQAYDFLCEIAGQTPIVPIPTFADAYETQRVLEAAMLAAEEKRWVKVADVK